MGARIRVAEPRDLRAVLGLAAVVHGGSAEPLIAGAVGQGLVVVAESGGALVGYAVLERPLPGHLRVADVGVRPSHRRQGVGSALLGRVLGEFRAAEVAENRRTWQIRR